MMIWILGIFMMAMVCGVVIFWARLPRNIWVLPCSAGALALAGYAYQGRPDINASLAQPINTSVNNAQLIAMRQEMDQTFSHAKRYLTLSDSMTNNGNYSLAASIIQNGLNNKANDHELWGALGVQLMLASDLKISPPAKLAFARSREFWPRGPVPDYFEGLAALFEGRLSDTERYWKNALKNATPKAKYRPLLIQQLEKLEQLQNLNEEIEAQ